MALRNVEGKAIRPALTRQYDTHIVKRLVGRVIFDMAENVPQGRIIRYRRYPVHLSIPTADICPDAVERITFRLPDDFGNVRRVDVDVPTNDPDVQQCRIGVIEPVQRRPVLAGAMR